MTNKVTTNDKKLPSIEELYTDIQLYEKMDEVSFLLNQNPPEKWIKTHPFVKNHLYIPIDKVEYLLRRIFKDYGIEITGQGTAFNGVWVTVRVHYKDITSGEMKFHDGIGASELQTKKGESVANLNAINSGAISMAFPIAKTLAVKDACDHFGRLFGSDLNRKDIAPMKTPESLKKVDHDHERQLLLINSAKTIEDFEFAKTHVTDKTLIPLLQAYRIAFDKENDKK